MPSSVPSCWIQIFPSRMSARVTRIGWPGAAVASVVSSLPRTEALGATVQGGAGSTVSGSGAAVVETSPREQGDLGSGAAEDRLEHLPVPFHEAFVAVAFF